jgi:hypothetical protein
MTKLLPLEAYASVISRLQDFTVLIIKKIYPLGLSHSDRDEIVANFLARSIISLHSIWVLYETGDYSNCMIILRCIIDRLLHLGYINEKNAFEKFRQLSLVERHKYLHKIKSDATMTKKEGATFKLAYKLSSKIVDYIQRHGANSFNWKGVKPKETAKEMGLEFIYHFGYDHASSYVHPMADEGTQDIMRLLGLPPVSLGADSRTILQNASLSMQLLLRNALLSTEIKWDNRYYQFLDNIMHYTGTGEIDFLNVSDHLLRSIRAA